MSFFDIHSHKQTSQPGSTTVINVSSDFENISKDGFYSAGLHPWHIESKTASAEWLSVRDACKKGNIVAIGECGLDKVCKTDWALQVDYFIKQIKLANSLRKPLIIHCVKAFDEVLQILQEQNVSVPVIFHGFNKSVDLAQKIIYSGYYLSFGKHLFNESIKTVLCSVPRERIFLETDNSDIDIKEVYETAAQMLGIQLNEMKVLINQNIIRIFGNALLKNE